MIAMVTDSNGKEVVIGRVTAGENDEELVEVEYERKCF